MKINRTYESKPQKQFSFYLFKTLFDRNVSEISLRLFRKLIKLNRVFIKIVTDEV